MKMNIISFSDNNTDYKIEQINRPNTYKDLIDIIKQKINPKSYKLFYLSKERLKVPIDEKEEGWKQEENIFLEKKFVLSIKGSYFHQMTQGSPDDKKDELEDKYSCLLCGDDVKNEKPIYCYNCQKVFHKKCFDIYKQKKEKENKKILACPACTTEFPFDIWRTDIGYLEKREKEAKIFKLENDNFWKMYLKFNEEKQEKMAEWYKQEQKKMAEWYKQDKKLFTQEVNDLLEKLKSIFIKCSFDNENNLLNLKKQLDFEKYDTFKSLKIINSYLDKLDKKLGKKCFTVIHSIPKEGEYNIFGKSFVETNKNYIKLKLNDNYIDFTGKTKLKEGEQKLTFEITEITHPLLNLSEMFNNCYTLINISELKY